MRAWLGLLPVLVACTLVEPLDGFEGPAAATGGKPTASGGTGGVGAFTAGASGFPTVECKDAADCADGDACNGDEICLPEGICAAGKPPKLDDGNSCTVDFCDPKTGVQHKGGAGPSVKACASTSSKCPAGYYAAAALICDTECGGPDNCGFCINGLRCEQACLAKVQVCCASTPCKDACPAGYAFVKEIALAACGCGSALPAAECQRK